ncbi:hypothetical protein BC830DRAFT_1088964 [Chytriomyces sp. MP71]|nr:hypothetical protein BC830DRAFT_1088964 [Chytriomyces sp. MP71]
MDDDLRRWRKLGGDPLYSEPFSNGAVFTTKKKNASKHVPVHIPHKHPSKLVLSDLDRGRHAKEERVFVHNILDRISEKQKKDIGVLWSGHLNHNNINKVLVTETLKQRKFGAGPPPPKTPPPLDPYTFPDPKSPELQPVDSVSFANIGHIDAPDNMHDLLEQFDTVKLQQHEAYSQPRESPSHDEHADLPPPPVNSANSRSASRAKGKHPVLVDHDDPAYRRRFLPAYQLNVTKHGQYKSLRQADHDIVGSDWTRKKESLKSAKLAELTTFLRTELEALGCAETGPDLRRLQVYRYVFDRLIAEFRHYGPILAEIKSEYDAFIASYSLDQNELNFLRVKVRKLLAQNENRLLLKFERKKSIQMETLIEHLKAENDFLNSELRRKLALYASYLPQQSLNEKKRDDTMLREIEPGIKRFSVGEDPITLYEKQIKTLAEEGNSKSAEIARLRKAQQDEYVPREVHDTLDINHKEVMSKYLDLTDVHEKLQEELKNKLAMVAKLEAALKEKEDQYHFLIAEYTGLTESMAKK